jgi:hypothetical protein
VHGSKSNADEAFVKYIVCYQELGTKVMYVPIRVTVCGDAGRQALTEVEPRFGHH